MKVNNPMTSRIAADTAQPDDLADDNFQPRGRLGDDGVDDAVFDLRGRLVHARMIAVTVTTSPLVNRQNLVVCRIASCSSTGC